jgi:hypothetical protein
MELTMFATMRMEQHLIATAATTSTGTGAVTCDVRVQKMIVLYRNLQATQVSHVPKAVVVVRARAHTKARSARTARAPQRVGVLLPSSEDLEAPQAEATTTVSTHLGRMNEWMEGLLPHTLSRPVRLCQFCKFDKPIKSKALLKKQRTRTKDR